MWKVTSRIVGSALGIALAVLSLGAQVVVNPMRGFGTIDGLVSDTSMAPLHAAFVSIVGTQIRVGTGPNGRFRIARLQPGEYLLIVKRVGYRPTSGIVNVPVSDTVRLSYTLEPITTTKCDVPSAPAPGSAVASPTPGPTSSGLTAPP